MFFYSIYGLNIKSDYEMEEACSIFPTDMVDVIISRDTIDEEFTTETEEELTKGKGYILIHKDNWFCVRFVHQGAFFMKNGNRIKYQLKAESDPLMVTQILLCFCLSVTLMQRGQISLHGSGVLLNNKAIVITGSSGAGKSTLTAALIQAGVLFMADDMVAIGFQDEETVAYSAYPQRKLNYDVLEKLGIQEEDCIPLPDYDEVKYAVRQREMFYQGSAELGGIIVIEPTDEEEVQLIKIDGSDKIKYVMHNVFQKGFYRDNEFGKEQFSKCIKIAEKSDIYIIKRPKNKLTFKEMTDLVTAIEW